MTTTQETTPTPTRPPPSSVAAAPALHVREWGRPDGSAGAPDPWLVGQPHVLEAPGRRASWPRSSAWSLSTCAATGCPTAARRRSVPRAALWADDIAAVIDQCELDRPTLVGWSYGGFVICDYVRAYGQDGISAINFVGAAVTLNERFDDIGPAFLTNAPGGADPDLPTRIAALRRFWHSMTAEPLSRDGLETGLCGSVSVPPQVLGALISRQIDSDDVLGQLRVPVLVTPRSAGPDRPAASMAEHILRVCPTAQASWYDVSDTCRSSRTRTASTASWPSCARRAAQ